MRCRLSQWTLISHTRYPSSSSRRAPFHRTNHRQISRRSGAESVVSNGCGLIVEEWQHRQGRRVATILIGGNTTLMTRMSTPLCTKSIRSIPEPSSLGQRFR